MSTLDRVIWEGWTAQNFIYDLEPMIDMIMNYESFIEPFKTKREISKYIRENQSYYKKSIPEVDEYFAKKYGLK